MKAEELAVGQEALLLHCALHTGYVTAKAALRGGFTHLLYGARYTLIFSLS